MDDELIHQSVRDRQCDGEEPVRRIACGLNIFTVRSTPICADVTCPACKMFQQKVVEAVFTPLPGGSD